MSGGIRGYVPALDGIRALAIGMVMLGHLWQGPDLPGLRELARAGPYGVDVFFVLSGFLITGILLRNLDRPRYYHNFYVRRALRILPLYWCYLTLIFGPRIALELSGAPTPPSAGPPWVYYLFVSNFYFVSIAEFPDSLLDMTWSLCIEEQFYLTFPFLVAALPRRALVVGLVGITAIAGPLRYLVYDPNNLLWAYVFTPMRSDGLALGALVAIAMHHGRDGLLEGLRRLLWPLSAALAILVAIDFLASYPGPMAVMHTLVSAWTAALVIALLSGQNPRLDAIMSWGPLVYLGRISYAMYLLHPAAYMVTSLILLQLGVPGTKGSFASALAHMGIASLASVGMATLTWRTLEEPMLKLKDRFAPNHP